MTSIEFDVLGTPAPQGSKRAFNHRTTGRVVTIESGHAKVQTWRGDVVRAAMEARDVLAAEGHRSAGYLTEPLFTGPVHVDVEYRFVRPKSHYRTGRNAHILRDTAPAYPAGKPDVDKLQRSTFDALSAKHGAGLWRDDCQVVDVHASKVYAARAGATIRVRATDHAEQYEPLEEATA